MHESEESDYLLRRRYGTVVLDEAHRARRRGGLGRETGIELVTFMLRPNAVETFRRRPPAI